MQIKLGESVMVCGIAPKDAEMKIVGEKNSSVCNFGLKVGERKVDGQDKPEAIWCNCTAWHSAARTAQAIKKGDTVLVIGKIKQATGKDGKEYNNLECDFISIMADKKVNLDISAESYSVPSSEFQDVTGGDDDLPF